METVDSFDNAFRSVVETGKVTINKVMEERNKKARLAQLIKETPVDELDGLIQQLEFANTSSSSIDSQSIAH